MSNLLKMASENKIREWDIPQDCDVIFRSASAHWYMANAYIKMPFCSKKALIHFRKYTDLSSEAWKLFFSLQDDLARSGHTYEVKIWTGKIYEKIKS